jgi:hypothetical protein
MGTRTGVADVEYRDHHRGGGYQYLTKEVASGAEDYYIRAGAGSGEAQGWWLGGQRQAFGVARRVGPRGADEGVLRHQI